MRRLLAPVSRRIVLGAGAGLGAGFGATLAGMRPGFAQAAPVTLTVVDVAGNLQLTQGAIEEYKRDHGSMISRVNYGQAPAPELPGKIKAQQAAGRLDIDIVLTGTDALAAGIGQGIWETILPDHASALPANLEQLYQPAAWAMQGLAQGQALCTVFCPGGPLLEYMPDRVAAPPGTIEELLAWTQAHPKRFLYARPANSGPGRCFLMGLPYLLGDKDPKDPKDGWDKTWSFLEALGKNIEYYPAGTTATMKELGDGTRDMIVTMTGWDINPRALGVVPKEAKVAPLKGFHFVNDAQYMAVPKGLPPERLAAVLGLMSWMITPKAQAYAWDKGFFYPGPAGKDVPLSLAAPESQAVIAEFGRDFYPKLIADTPNELPLAADRMVYAFHRWDEQIGAKVGK
jgi:putative spermidine/putrescine transport system substrate-binding protein